MTGASWNRALARECSILGILFLLGTASACIIDSRIAARESAAYNTLRALHQALAIYKAKCEGFPATLTPLAPPPPGEQIDCQHIGTIVDPYWVETLLAPSAAGDKGGYHFTYQPAALGPPEQSGHITSYTLSARPIEYGRTGKRSFFMDESGVIRLTIKDRPATPHDPPLP